MKFLKGMLGLFIIYLIVLTSSLILNSCEESKFKSNNSEIAKTKFLTAIDANKMSVGAISINKTNKDNCALKGATTETLTFYLDFPIELDENTSTEINNTGTINEISGVIHEFDATLQYSETPTNSDYQFEVEIENVVNNLSPLIEESKQYLFSKGLTNQDIQDMLIEEGGQESDLVPFVMLLTQIESTPAIAQKYSNFFINSACANPVSYHDYIDCAIMAIGADILFSLGSSMASTWSVAVIKKAFGAVAKRALGPIGAAIAVVTFGVCIYQKYE